jgi:hypothetical protein
MDEKRNYPRFAAEIKAEYIYFEGNPETIDISRDKGIKGYGVIMDISQGGVFIISDEHVAVTMPVITSFTLGKQNYEIPGKVVRTGLIVDNPSELAQRFALSKVPGSIYIAIEFTSPMGELDITKNR